MILALLRIGEGVLSATEEEFVVWAAMVAIEGYGGCVAGGIAAGDWVLGIDVAAVGLLVEIA